MAKAPVDTALVIVVGPCIDDTDFKTIETGIAYNAAGMDLSLYKESATGTPTKTALTLTTGGAQDWVELGDGYYSVEVTAAQNDTEGKLWLGGVLTGVLPFESVGVLEIVPSNVHASLVTGAANLQVDATKISGDSTAADNMEATYDGTGYSDPNAPAKQSQLDTIANTGGATWKASSAFVITTGTEDGANTYTVTEALDEVYHTLLDAAGTLDAYYEFDIGATGVPSSINLEAYLTNSNDTVQVYAYNFTLASWVQVGEIAGKNQTTRETFNFKIPSSLVGSNGDVGKVRIRIHGTGLSSASFNLDQGLLGYNPIYASATGYANGAIWLDTVNGFAGTVSDVHGVADHPVDNWADALTLLAAKKFTRIEIANGSSVTLTAATEGLLLHGSNWNLALGGQSISNSTIIGAVVSGVATGSGASVIGCFINVATLPPCCYQQCKFNMGITLNGAGDYIFDYCSSNVADAGTPYLDYGVAGAHNVSMRHYSGGTELRNMTAADKMSLEGWGQFIIAASCSGGALSPRGNFKKTDNSGGAVTITEDALDNREGFRDAMKLAPTAGAPAADSVDAHLDTLVTASAFLDVAVSSRATPGDVGALEGAVTIQLRVKDDSDILVEGVSCAIYDAAGTSYKGTQTTDANGITMEFGRNVGVHTIVPVIAGYAGLPQQITVSAAGIYDISVTSQLPPPPTRPGVCTVSATLWDGELNAMEDEVLIFQAIVPQKISGALLDSKEISKTSAASGLVYAGLAKARRYMVMRPSAGLRTEFTTPDADTFDISDLVN